MKWTKEKIRKSFSGRLIGHYKMVKAVCDTLLLLPSETIQYVTQKIWFITTPFDAWGFTFRGSDIRGQYLVFLSDELFTEKKKSIRYTILHEIGHVIKKHRNSMGFRQTEKEVNIQEEEADQFAKKVLNSQ